MGCCTVYVGTIGEQRSSVSGYERCPESILELRSLRAVMRHSSISYLLRCRSFRVAKSAFATVRNNGPSAPVDLCENQRAGLDYLRAMNSAVATSAQ